jgi:formylglycine-generating enzyme required for sulfatase activity
MLRERPEDRSSTTRRSEIATRTAVGRTALAAAMTCMLSCQRVTPPTPPEKARSRVSAGSSIAIKGGTFNMGCAEADAGESDNPPHAVTVRSFEIDKTEVTVDAYAACVKAEKCSDPLSFVDEKRNFRALCNWKHPEGRGAHPVNCVSWDQAAAYCAFAGKRLPTEEEWEYAARAGAEERKYPWGSDPPDATRVNACGAECPAGIQAKGLPGWPPLYPASDGFAETAPVGSYPNGASKDGVLDLAGNVWEWTASEHATCASAPNCKRVLRGGSFGGGDARTIQSTNRFRLAPSSQSEFLGFRCAR